MDANLETAIRRIVCEELAAVLAGTSYEPTWTTAPVAEFLGLKPKTIRNRISLREFPKPRKQGRLNAFIPYAIATNRAEQFGLNPES